jgi:hypothetical protein
MKPNLEIRARAKNASMARQHNALDAVVDIEHAVGFLELEHHGVGEGIVVLGPVQCQDDDAGVAGVVPGADLCEGEGVVGLGEFDCGAGVGHCACCVGGSGGGGGYG